MTSIFNALNAGIYSALSAGTALTASLGGTAIYYMQAPDGAALPYVVWNYQGGGPENINPSNLHNNVVFIRAYASTPAQAGTIDGQVDALIDKKALTVSGFTNFYTARETDLALVEDTPTGAVYMAGALYRLRLDD